MAKKKNKNKKTAAPSLEEIASIGDQDFGALFDAELRLPSDETFNRRGSDIAIYEKVLRDAQCKSTFQQRRLAVIAREWYVEPGGPGKLDIMAADHLREQLKGLAWDKATFQMLSGVWNGYSVAECIFGVDSNRYYLDAIKVRKARRFRFDREDRLRLVTRDKPQGVVMPENKFWVFRASSDDDDEAYPLGLGYYNFWPVWLKRGGLKFWSLFMQRFASPTPIAKIPPGSTEPERAKVLRMLGDIVTGGRIAIPNNIALDLLQAVGSSGGDYVAFCRYMDAEIAKITLSQTMTTDDGSSRAQADVHADVKLEVVKSDADLECESFNSSVAEWLTEWNFPGAIPPRAWRRVEDPADLNAQAERDKVIYDMGYEPTEEYVRETYGDGFRRRQVSREGSAVAAGAGAPAEFAEDDAPPVVGPSASVLETAIGGDEWERLLGPEVHALEDLVSGAGSLETVRARLGEYAQRNPDAVTESLARVLFASRVTGEVGADIDGDN